MFTPNFGFTPRTRVEMVHDAWVIYNKITGSQCSFDEFQGTNVHLICNIFFNEIEKVEAMFLELLVNQFQFWGEKNLALKGSFGASYEGWQNCFKELCESLDILASDDPRAQTLDPVPRPGEIVIYFDDLKTKNENFKDKFHDAFRDCKNIAEPTVHGNKTIEIVYSNNESRKYLYNHLKADEYTKIDVQIILESVGNETQYKDSDFEDELRSKFSMFNRINRPFFAKTYVDITKFYGLKNLELKTKLESDTNWVSGDREIDLGKKYVIRTVEILRLSS